MSILINTNKHAAPSKYSSDLQKGSSPKLSPAHEREEQAFSIDEPKPSSCSPASTDSFKRNAEAHDDPQKVFSFEKAGQSPSYDAIQNSIEHPAEQSSITGQTGLENAHRQALTETPNQQPPESTQEVSRPSATSKPEAASSVDRNEAVNSHTPPQSNKDIVDFIRNLPLYGASLVLGSMALSAVFVGGALLSPWAIPATIVGLCVATIGAYAIKRSISWLSGKKSPTNEASTADRQSDPHETPKVDAKPLLAIKDKEPTEPAAAPLLAIKDREPEIPMQNQALLSALKPNDSQGEETQDLDQILNEVPQSDTQPLSTQTKEHPASH